MTDTEREADSIKLLVGHLKTMIIIIENEGCNSFEQKWVDEAKMEVAKYDP